MVFSEVVYSAHSISDLRGEISGRIVMAQLSSATSRETTYWFLVSLCSRYFVCACASFPNCNAHHNHEKKPSIKGMNEATESIFKVL